MFNNFGFNCGGANKVYVYYYMNDFISGKNVVAEEIFSFITFFKNKGISVSL